jgi:putative tryptophan/tyrosine transport system substrate-binding protein
MRRRFRQRNCRIGCDFASCCGRTAAGDSRGKRLALLHDIIPNISTVGLLTDPSDPEGSSQRADAQGVAGRLNLKLVIVNASTEREIDAAFATFAQQQVGAVIIGSNPFFTARREQIISLAARHRMPGIYPVREYVASGGLMSYGNNLTEAYRHAGLYVGRILGAPSQLTYLSNG